ncbi:hypothetical protein ACHAPT_001719 [Fusarium lateritium]
MADVAVGDSLTLTYHNGGEFDYLPNNDPQCGRCRFSASLLPYKVLVSWSLAARTSAVKARGPGQPRHRTRTRKVGVSKTFRSPHRSDRGKDRTDRLKRANDLLLSAPEVDPFRHVETNVTV